MSSNKWKQYKLGDLYDLFTGLSKPREEFGFGTPFITFRDVFNNYFLPENIESLANTTQKERESCSVKKGDIFLTRTSETLHELGMSSVALKDYPNTTFNGFTKRLRLKNNSQVDIDLIFLGYYLRSPFFRSQIGQHSSLTTRASLNNAAINSLEICLPENITQKKIGEILKSVDDKIENNMATNQTLEETATTIFKEWFVQFNYPGADGKMKNSELGTIPQNWKVGKLGDNIMFRNGKILPPKNYASQFQVFGANGVIGLADQFNSREKSIIIGRVGRYCGNVFFSINKCFVTDNAIIAEPKEIYSSLFYFQFLKHLNLNNLKGGSGQYLLNQTILNRISLVIPSLDILKEFELLLLPIFQKIEDNIEENENLKELRDSLLPKLMAGEIILQ